jgi:hypothetical protein
LHVGAIHIRGFHDDAHSDTAIMRVQQCIADAVQCDTVRGNVEAQARRIDRFDESSINTSRPLRRKRTLGIRKVQLKPRAFHAITGFKFNGRELIIREAVSVTSISGSVIVSLHCRQWQDKEAK